MNHNYKESKLIENLANTVFMTDKERDKVAKETSRAGIDVEAYFSSHKDICIPEVVKLMRSGED